MYVHSRIKWRRSKKKIAAVDLDLAFCKSDASIAYKFHITHENKVYLVKIMIFRPLILALDGLY